MFAVWTFDVTSYIWVCSKAEFWKSVFFLREWETCGVVGFCAMFTVAPSEYCLWLCMCVCWMQWHQWCGCVLFLCFMCLGKVWGVVLGWSC